MGFSIFLDPIHEPNALYRLPQSLSMPSADILLLSCILVPHLLFIRSTPLEKLLEVLPNMTYLFTYFSRQVL